MKKFLVIMVSVMSVLAFTGSAFAVNQVYLKTTVPNIPKSYCEQAGSITQEFQDGAELEEGDIIQFTLSNLTSLCKDIDFYLVLATANQMYHTSNARYPVTVSQAGLNLLEIFTDATLATLDANVGGLYDVGFLVRGTAGSQLITLELVRRYMPGVGDVDADGLDEDGQIMPTANPPIAAFFSVNGGDSTDVLTVKLFDEKCNNSVSDPGCMAQDYFWEDWSNTLTSTLGAKDYLDEIEADDNVICVDTLTKNFNGEYVLASPDSIVEDDSHKITFSGDYFIAHILTEEAWTIEPPCKYDCPSIPIEPTIDQYGNVISSVTSFDPGTWLTSPTSTNRWISTGSCALKEGVAILVTKGDGDMTKNDEFKVRMEVLVNGQKDSAVYFSSYPTMYWTDSDDPDICAVGGTLTSTAPASWSYVTPAGTTTQDKTMIYTGWDLVATGTDDALLIDVGSIYISGANLEEGDEITVLVHFDRFPCGELVSEEICVAQIIETCPTTALSDNYRMVFPYYTAPDLDLGFWGGIVINNLSSVSGSADIMFMDANGGTGMTTWTIGAGRQELGLLSSMVDDLDAGSTLNTGISGYVIVDCDFQPDGLMFVGDYPGLNYLHGYLPRVWTVSSTGNYNSAIH